MQTIKVHPAFYPLIADGRKTMTRRVVKEALDGRWGLFNLRTLGDRVVALFYHDESARELEVECPYAIGEIVKWGNGEGRILDIRCERLQDISEMDAFAEGLNQSTVSGRFYSPIGDVPMHYEMPRNAFISMWQRLYPTGPESWESNPCVWALTIEKIGEGDANS